MFVPYGWPLGLDTGFPDGEAPIFAHSGEDVLLLVTRERIQAWTAGSQRVRLGETLATEDEGHITAAHWDAARGRLVVVTESGRVQLFALHVGDRALATLPDGAEARCVDIYVRSSVSLGAAAAGEQAAAVLTDTRTILIVLASGAILAYSWSLRLRGSGHLLAGSSDWDRSSSEAGPAPARSPSPSDEPEAADEAGERLDPARDRGRRPRRHHGEDGPPQVAARGISAGAGLLAFLTEDGCVGVAALPPEGASAPERVAFLRWVHAPRHHRHAPRLGGSIGHALPAIAEAGREAPAFLMGRGEEGITLPAWPHGDGTPLPQSLWAEGPEPPTPRPAKAHHGSLATSLALSERAASLAVGQLDGRVALYDLASLRGAHSWHGHGRHHTPAPSRAVRQLTPHARGAEVRGAGSATCISWAPDGRALAAGFSGGGAAAWVPSGCCLFCTAEDTEGEAGAYPDAFATLVTWDGLGQRLLIAGTSAEGQVEEVRFARAPAALSRSPLGVPPGAPSAFAPSPHGPAGDAGLLLGVDRILVAQGVTARGAAAALARTAEAARGSDPDPVPGLGPEESPLPTPDWVLEHLCPPPQYVADAAPLRVAELAPDSGDVVVAGSKGVAVWRSALRRWRVFGDVSHERRLTALHLAWLDGGLVVATGRVARRGPTGAAGQAWAGVPGRAPIGVTSSSSRGGLEGAITAPIADAGLADASARGSQAPEPVLLLLDGDRLDLDRAPARLRLPRDPTALDATRDTILLMHEPLEVTLLTARRDLRAGGTVRLHVAKELSVGGMGDVVAEAALLRTWADQGRDHGWFGSAAQQPGTPASPPFPGTTFSSCLLLRAGGRLSLLDLDLGTERTLATRGVERAWLAAGPAPLRPGEPAWWTHGPRGTEPWYPALALPSFGAGPFGSPIHVGQTGYVARTTATWPPGAPGAARDDTSPRRSRKAAQTARGVDRGIEPELAVDPDAYPVALSREEGVLVLASPMSSLGHGPDVRWDAQTECRPLLPAVLRRALAAGDTGTARDAAEAAADGLGLARALEWLLFTALEATDAAPGSAAGESPHFPGSTPGTPAAQSHSGWATTPRRASAPSTPSANGGRGRTPRAYQTVPLRAAPDALGAKRGLASVCELLRTFPRQRDAAVVSVARKTDVALWPALFEAVGPPGRIARDLVARGETSSAACLLVVVHTIEGPRAATVLAEAIVRAALARGRYPLVGEVLRFVFPPSEGALLRAAVRAARERGAVAQVAATPRTPGEAAFISPMATARGPLPEDPFGAPQSPGSPAAVEGQPASPPAGLPVAARSSWGWGWLKLGWSTPPEDRATPEEAMGGPVLPPDRALPPPSLPDEEEPTEVADEALTPAIAIWHTLGAHAWHLLDQGRLRDAAALGAALERVCGPDLGSLLVESSEDVDPRLVTRVQRMTAASVAAALRVVACELAAYEAGGGHGNGSDLAGVVALLLQATAAASAAPLAVGLAAAAGHEPLLSRVAASDPMLWERVLHVLPSDPLLATFATQLDRVRWQGSLARRAPTTGGRRLVERMRRAHGLGVLYVRELNTSLVCSRCRVPRRLEPVGGAASPRFVRRCANTSCATGVLNRDVNAARNIAFLTGELLAGRGRPEPFSSPLPPLGTDRGGGGVASPHAAAREGR